MTSDPQVPDGTGVPAQPPGPTSWGGPASTPPPGQGAPPASPPGTPPAPAGPPPAAPPPSGWGAPPGGPQPGPSGAPAAWNPSPAAPSSSGGCLKACLIVAAIGAVLFFVVIVGLIFLGNQIVEDIGVNPDGSVGKACAFVTSEELSDAIGSPAEVIALEGLFDATLGLVLDKRVLPDAEDCWITADSETPTGRLARYVGADAAQVYATERQKAEPTSEDQGGGITLENEGYFAGDVDDLGDEAFCTGLSPAIMSGVLVRRGDTLVYVSLSGPADGPPDLESTIDGVVFSPDACRQAAEVARRILE